MNGRWRSIAGTRSHQPASIAAAIVFLVVGGLQTIPDNIKSVAFVFNALALASSGHITLPAISLLIVTDPEADGGLVFD